MSCVNKQVSPEIETKSQRENDGELSTRKQIANPFVEFIEKSSPRDKSDYRNRNPFENDDLNPFLTPDSDQTLCLEQTRNLKGSLYKSLTTSENITREEETPPITKSNAGDSLEARLHFLCRYKFKVATKIHLNV